MNSYKQTGSNVIQMLKSRHFWRGAGDACGKMLAGMTLALIIAALIIALSGCGTRYIIERPGNVGTLMDDVEATVSFPDKDGNPVPAKGTLPKGTLVNGPKPIPKGCEMIIAVDFDGTCCDHRYPQIGDAAPLALETLRDLVKQDHRLILWTMRSHEELEQARQWLIDNGVTLWGTQRNPEQDGWTNSPKCYAQLYIDDAAFGCPLIHPEGFNRPCVDWSKVREKFNMGAR